MIVRWAILYDPSMNIRQISREISHVMTLPAASRLTNDYINHFGELVMLLEMLVDSPELIDEARAWAPRSYPEHLDRISFAAVQPLREAYNDLEPERRALLDDTAADANRLGMTVSAVLGESDEVTDRLLAIIRIVCAAMHAHINRLAQILSGAPLEMIDVRDVDVQAEIDALMASA
jgi:hypothetical protein